jgi:hypothetical protein
MRKPMYWLSYPLCVRHIRQERLGELALRYHLGYVSLVKVEKVTVHAKERLEERGAQYTH